jgi:MFS family permease
VILGMIVTMFSEPREQAKAIGVFAFVASAGAAVGLLAGGILTQFLNWHWIFFVNLPIGAVTAAAARRMIGRDRGAGLRGGADVPGAVLITGAMMLGVFTIVGPAAQEGWLAAKTLGVGAGSLVLLGGFIFRQRTARSPLMPLRIFSVRNVAGANLVQMFGTAGMFGMFFLGSLYLRRILGYDPLQIGLAFLPVAVVMGTLSVRYTDRLVIRFGARATTLTGLGLIAAGLALFATVPAGGGYPSHIFPVAVLVGAGAGLCFPALMALAMSSATPQDAGLASGLVNTTAQIGGALGLAVLSTVSASRSRTLLAQHHPAAAALTDGYHLAFWIACGLVITAAVITATTLHHQPTSSSEGAFFPVQLESEPQLHDCRGGREVQAGERLHTAEPVRQSVRMDTQPPRGLAGSLTVLEPDARRVEQSLSRTVLLGEQAAQDTLCESAPEHGVAWQPVQFGRKG